MTKFCKIIATILICFFIQIIIPFFDSVYAMDIPNNNIENLNQKSQRVDKNVILNVNSKVDEGAISIKEDIDINGMVDIIDLAEISTQYYINSEDLNYDIKYDINKDGIIDIFDLVSVAKKIGDEPFLVAGTYEENNSLLKYLGDWSKSNDNNYSKGEIKSSSKSGTSIEFKFYGTGFEWYGLFSENSGKANIYVDGKYIITSNQYLWDDYYNKLAVFKNDLALGEHRVKIENIESKQGESKGTNISVDRIIINNTSIMNDNFRIYQQTTSGGDLYVGQYNRLEEAKIHSNLYHTTYVLDKNNKEVWVNSYRVLQDIGLDKNIEIGRYMDLEEAIEKASQFKSGYVLDLEGKEIWRGNYEYWSGTVFQKRFDTLEEAKNIAIEYDDSVIKDINNNIVWENKFTVYQITESGQTQANIGQYSNLKQAKERAEAFYNTKIINGIGNTIWNNGYWVFQQTKDGTITVGVYDTIGSAKVKANEFKNAYVIDPSEKEVWRGRYESFKGTEFKGRYNTKDEAITIASDYSDGLVRDVTDFDKVVWKKQEDIKEGYVSTDGAPLNVRSGPGTQFQSLGKLNNGEKVVIVDSSNLEWYKIKYGSEYGYVIKTYVKLGDAPAISTKIGYVSISGATLNVRIGPGTTHTTVGKLQNDQSVEIVDSSNSEWYKIKYSTSHGPYGYVSKKYIVFNKETAMKISEALVEFVKAYEGFYSKPYICAGGKLTIGYGYVIRPGESFTSITKEQATELLKKELKGFESQVNSLCSSNGVKLTQQEFDALVSFSFNLGIGNLKKSDLFENIKNGVRDPKVLKSDFRVWRMASGKPLVGLERRRLDEWQMFCYGDYKRENLI